MSDLLMIVPSRGRPGNVVQLVDAFNATCEPGSTQTHLLVAVDDDDPELPQYQRLFDEEVMRPLPVELTVGPRMRLGPTLNILAVSRASRHFAVGFMGDDHRPRTKGWDTQFLNVLRSLRTGLVYGDDLFQGEKLPTAVAMTSDIVSLLGYMVPATLTHMYLDNYWLELGRRLDSIRYLSNVVIEHMHPFAGKAPMDPGYEEVNSREQYRTDRQAYAEYLRDSMTAEVARIEQMIMRNAMSGGAR